VYFALNELKRQKTFLLWLKNGRAVRYEVVIKPVDTKKSQQEDIKTLIKPVLTRI
jgi:hypothetical protein